MWVGVLGFGHSFLFNQHWLMGRVGQPMWIGGLISNTQYTIMIDKQFAKIVLKRRPWRVTLWRRDPHCSTKLTKFLKQIKNINIWCLFYTDHSDGWQSNSFYQRHHNSSILSLNTFSLCPFWSVLHLFLHLVSRFVGQLICWSTRLVWGSWSTGGTWTFQGNILGLKIRKCEGKNLGFNLTSSSWR